MKGHCKTCACNRPKLGSRLRHRENDYILASYGHDKYMLINLRTGIRWTDAMFMDDLLEEIEEEGFTVI